MFWAAAQWALCAPVSDDAPARQQRSEPTIAEYIEARELGRGEGSVEGLQALIERRQPKLIEYYGSFFGGWSYSKLSPGIEALVTRNMNDPAIGPALLRLTRNAKYQTRRLFDLLGARIAGAPSPDWVALSAIPRTDLPGVESEILKLAERFPAGQFDEDSATVLRFFGERKYAPAVPFLLAVMQGRKLGDSAVQAAAGALINIGTQPATTAVLDRLEWLARQPLDPQQAQGEIQFLMYALSQMPETAPLDFVRLRRILSGRLLEANQGVLLDIARKRKALEAVPDFLSALANEPQSAISNPAFNALLGFDSIEVWRKTRDEIERRYRAKEISDDYHASALRILDERLKDPEKVLAQSRQASRVNAFNDRYGQINALRLSSQTLKAGDPDKYVVAQLQYLEKLGKLSKEYEDVGGATGLRNRIAEDYVALGNFVRFKLKQPAKAIHLYERAPDSLVAQIAAADAARFDLRDRVGAIRHYERALDMLKDKRVVGEDLDVPVSTWMGTWIGHEIAYLKTGRLFTGILSHDDLIGFSFILFWGASMMQAGVIEFSPDAIALTQSAHQGKVVTLGERNMLAKELDKLPASHFSLFSSLGAATMLPNAGAVLHYFGKHDPAGYLTASLLGAVDLLNKQPANPGSELALLPGARVDPEMLDLASQRFFKKHRIVLNTGPDPRMASPEKTWMLYIEALKNGDVQTVEACLTPAMRAKLAPLFAAMSPDRLKKLAESFSGFAIQESSGQYREAVVTRGKQVGLVYFVNIGGAWKIQEM
jgi:tetratricopeptide (TPR) repeat protein